MQPHYTSFESVGASTPPETRIYAVGDIHGRADLLSDIVQRIEDDQRRRPVKHVVEIYLGDYVDRGPDSRGVIDILAARMVRNQAICLRGNHEALMECFFYDRDTLSPWLQLGALNTLAAYQALPVTRSDGLDAAAVHELFLRVFPRTHQLFLQCLRFGYRCGDFLFVHAGIRPNVPIERQDPVDLLWIRQEFLEWPHMHEAIVVHGHTPVPHPDVRHNRINIDTGAWRSGVLTCVVLEGTSIQFL